jgi:hypothetical protein
LQRKYFKGGLEIMRNCVRVLFMLIVFVFSWGSLYGFASENPKQLLVQIPAFSMNPGDKIVGVKITLTGGRVTHAFFPRGWSCRLNNNPGRDQLYYCSCPHSSYAITNSAKLPVLSIDDISGVGGRVFNIEATIEMEDGDGRGFTKQMQETDLSISK